jgi:hypothetical protein
LKCNPRKRLGSRNSISYPPCKKLEVGGRVLCEKRNSTLRFRRVTLIVNIPIWKIGSAQNTVRLALVFISEIAVNSFVIVRRVEFLGGNDAGM